MADQDFLLGFDVDVATLQSALGKIQGLVDASFESGPVENFSNKLNAAESKIESLAAEYANLDKAQMEYIENGIQGLGKLEGIAGDVIGRMRELNAAMAEQAAIAERVYSNMGGGLARVSRLGTGETTFGSPFDNATIGFRSDKSKPGSQAGQTLFAQQLQAEETRSAQAIKQFTENNKKLAMNIDDRKKLMEDANSAFSGNGAVEQGINAGLYTFVGSTSPEAFNEDRLGLEDVKRFGSTAKSSATEADAAFTGFWGHQGELVGLHILRWTAFGAVLGAIFGTIQAVDNSLKEGIGTAAEFQTQTVQINSLQGVMHSAGIRTDQTEASQIYNAASILAAKYGDNINDVVQSLMLWYKTTGDLNNAVAVTNDSLKFQIVTGTDLEDTYRTLTALQNQMAGAKMGLGDNSIFDLSKTDELLNKVYTASLVAGAGMKQLDKDGQEMGSGTANAAEILLHSLEQDGEALKKLGLNVSEVVALDQALITSMGNSGTEADSAAERISRLVGGIMELSKVSKAQAANKDLGTAAFEKMQQVLNTSNMPGFLERWLTFYDQLTQKEKNAVDVLLAGNRQYQIQGNLMEQLNGHYQKILQAEKDKEALDRAAAQMNDTFNTQVKQLQGLWQGVVAIIGSELIPALQATLKFTDAVITGIGLAMAQAHQGATGEHDIKNELAYKDHFTPKPQQMTFGAVFANTYGGTAASLAPDSENNQYFDKLKADFRKSVINSKTLTGGEQNTFLDMINHDPSMTQLISDFAYYHDKNSSLSGLDRIGQGQYDSLDISKAASLRYLNDHINDVMNFNYNKNNFGMGTPPGGGGSAAVPNVPASTKGLQDAAQQAKTALDALINDMHSYISTSEDMISSDQNHVQYLQHLMQLYGDSPQMVEKLGAAYRAENTEISNTRSGLELYIKNLEQQRNLAEQHVQNTPNNQRNTQQYAQWVHDVDQATTAIAEAQKEEQGLTNKLNDNTLALVENQNAIASRGLDKFYSISDRNVAAAGKNGNFNDMIQAYEDQAAGAMQWIDMLDHSTVQYQDALDQLSAKGSEAIETLRSKWASMADSIRQTTEEDSAKGLEDMFSLLSQGATPQEKDRLDLIKQFVDEQKQRNQLEEKYQQDMSQFGGTALEPQIQQMYDLGQATIAADAATAQYAYDLKSIEDSGVIKALTDSFDTLGKGLGQDASNSIFGQNALDNQIYGQSVLISQYEQEKQWLDVLYSTERNHSLMDEANHNLEIYMLDQQIEKTKQLQEAEKYREEHPGVFKQMGMEFTKSIVDSLVQQLQDKLKQTVLNAIMPGSDKQAEALAQQQMAVIKSTYAPATEKFNQAITGVFKPTIAQDLDTQTKRFDTTVEQPLTKAFGDFNTTVTDPLTKGLNQFHQDALTIQKAANTMASGSGGGPGGGAQGPTGFGTADIFGNLGGNLNISDVIQAADTNNWQAVIPTAEGSGIILGSASSLGSIIPSSLNGVVTSNQALGGGGGSGSDAGGYGQFTSDAGATMAKSFMSTLGGLLAIGGTIASASTPGDAALGAGLGAAIGAAIPGVGPLLGAEGGAGIGSLFGPHYNPTQNPDMFPSTGFAQGVANAQGAAGASGVSYTEDPALAASLGGMTELQYLDAFVTSHPGGQGLTGASLQLWQQVSQFTQGGQAVGVHGLNQGNIGLSNSTNNSAPTYDVMNWADLLNQIQGLTGAVQNLNQTISQASTEAIIGVNVFGGGAAFTPYMAAIPGLNPPINPAGYPGTATSPYVPGSPPPAYGPPEGSVGGLPGRVGGGGTSDSAYMYNSLSPGTAGMSSQSLNVTINSVLDGKTVAINTQSWMLQVDRRGYVYLQ